MTEEEAKTVELGDTYFRVVRDEVSECRMHSNILELLRSGAPEHLACRFLKRYEAEEAVELYKIKKRLAE